MVVSVVRRPNSVQPDGADAEAAHHPHAAGATVTAARRTRARQFYRTGHSTRGMLLYGEVMVPPEVAELQLRRTGGSELTEQLFFAFFSRLFVFNEELPTPQALEFYLGAVVDLRTTPPCVARSR